jgi:hypothetical protein
MGKRWTKYALIAVLWLVFFSAIAFAEVHFHVSIMHGGLELTAMVICFWLAVYVVSLIYTPAKPRYLLAIAITIAMVIGFAQLSGVTESAMAGAALVSMLAAWGLSWLLFRKKTIDSSHGEGASGAEAARPGADDARTTARAVETSALSGAGRPSGLAAPRR